MELRIEIEIIFRMEITLRRTLHGSAVATLRFFRAFAQASGLKACSQRMNPRSA